MVEVTEYGKIEPIDELGKMLKVLSNEKRLKLFFIIKSIKANEKRDINRLNEIFYKNCKKNSSDEKDIAYIEEKKEELFSYLFSLKDLIDSNNMPKRTEIKEQLKNSFKINISDEAIKNYLKDLDDKREVLDVRRLNQEMSNEYEVNIMDQGLRNHLEKLEKYGFISKKDVSITRSSKGVREVKEYESILSELAKIFFDLSTGESEYFEKCICTNEFELKIISDNGIETYSHVNNLKDGDIVRIGRKDDSYEKNEEEINMEIPKFYKGVSRISKPHAWIKFENGDFYIIDNETSAKTYLGLNKIESGKTIKLDDRTRIRLGSGEKSIRMFFKRTFLCF